MSCVICGRNSCTRSFHSLEEQEEFDKTYKVEETENRIKDLIERKINGLRCEYIEDVCYVKLSDVEDIVQSVSI